MAAEQTVDEAQSLGVRLSLKLKLTLLITSLLVLTVLLVSVFLVRQQQASLTSEMTKRGRTIARDLGNASKNPILSNDDLTLSLLVQDAMKDPDVVYVVFADADGKIVGHPDLSQIGQRLQRSDGLPVAAEETQVTPYVDPKHGKVIDFAVPLVFSKVPVGSLYLGFSRKPIDQAVATARNSTIVISAAMVILGVLGAVGLATVLSHPVMRLVEGTRAVAAGNFQINLPVTSRDEIGALTESFNLMAKNLREKEMIKRAFTRYVARQVVDEILKDPEKLAPEGGAPRRHGPVLRPPGIHVPVRAPLARGGRRRAERLLHADGRHDREERWDRGQVSRGRGHGNLRRADRPRGSSHPRGEDGPRDAG